MGIAIVLRDKQPYNSNILTISRGVSSDDILDACDEFSYNLHRGKHRLIIFNKLAGEISVCHGSCRIAYKLVNQVYILIITTKSDQQFSQSTTLLSAATVQAQLLGPQNITSQGLQQQYDQIYIGMSSILWCDNTEIEEHKNRLIGLFAQLTNNQVQDSKGRKNVEVGQKHVALEMKPRGKRTLKSLESNLPTTQLKISNDSLQFASKSKQVQSELPEKPPHIKQKEQQMQYSSKDTPGQQIKSRDMYGQEQSSLFEQQYPTQTQQLNFGAFDNFGASQNQVPGQPQLQSNDPSQYDGAQLAKQGFGIDSFQAGQQQQQQQQIQQNQFGLLNKQDLAQGSVIFRETYRAEIVKSQIIKAGLIGEIRWKGEPLPEPKEIVIQAASDIDQYQQEIVKKLLNFTLGSQKGGVYKRTKKIQHHDDLFDESFQNLQQQGTPNLEYLLQCPIKPDPNQSLFKLDQEGTAQEIPMLKYGFPGSCLEVPAKLNFDVKTRQNMQNFTYQCLMTFQIMVNPELIERMHGSVQLDIEVPAEAGRPTRVNPRGSWNSNSRHLRIKMPQLQEDTPSKVTILFEANISKDALAQVGVFGGVAGNVNAKTKATVRFLCQPGPSWSGVAVYSDELGGLEEIDSILGVEISATQFKQYY